MVSEQTGDISVAFRSRLLQKLNEGELRSELSRIFRIRAQDEGDAESGDGGPRDAVSLDASGEHTEKAAG